LILQKQSGQNISKLGISFTYPSQWKISQDLPVNRNNVSGITATQSFLAKEGKLEYNGDLSRDIRMKIYITR
jgi:hypothetical protein